MESNERSIAKKADRIRRGIADALGVWVPNITFTIIFITFMLTIVSRYIFKTPITWSYEVSILAYMWTMFFGVGKAMEKDEHVVFSLLYDKLGLKGQVACKVLYNVMMVALISLAFIPCVNSLLSKKMITGVLKLPYKIIFAPLLYMFADVIIRSIIDIVNSIKSLKLPKKTESEED